MSSPSAAPDLGLARGLWLTAGLIAWPRRGLPTDIDPVELDWTLHCAPRGGINPRAPEPVAWRTIHLRPRLVGLTPDLAARFPHLADAVALKVPGRPDVRELLRGQVAVVVQRPSGRLVDASGVQLAPVLDELYPTAPESHLGAVWDAGVPTLRVWAPTAHDVAALVWPDGRPPEDAPDRHPMTRYADGTWAVEGERSWSLARYLYAVTVYAPTFGRVVENRVTDPYSVALSVNSTHSVLVDLSDPALSPGVWAHTPSPPLAHPVDQVIYELHVRDFSRTDVTLPEELRGTYLAFARDGLGRRHLARLAAAGLTTVQLLPVFDYASVDEDPGRQGTTNQTRLRSAAPDSDEQQREVRRTPRRPFNWGYDPWHHQVPEGSYATPGGRHGAGRIVEARTMVGALHELGLRVVLDQVYNHTFSEGQGAKSVLGRIVPGYYHRRDETGAVATSTCCPNLATEHRMAEKLMVDAIVHWARHYRVDGFRFDLMGHHSRENILTVRRALDALTAERDGVDGRGVVLYGEGWDFGEVAGNARFVQASQGQLGGTRIATFSDRLRDAVRGGAPFDKDPRTQGFASGLAGAPNGAPVNGDPGVQHEALLQATDLIQLGLAGNLRAYTFTSARTGRQVRGDRVPYRHTVAGYADQPDEVISYVDAHDNETLYDALVLKLPADTPMDQRVRANTLALALATLGQSPVMWHAGADFLRSKSLDRNSFDSGDWFNQLDFSMADNGFGAGLPPEPDNKATWPYMKPLLARPDLKPTTAHMRLAHAMATDLLRIRSSSRLFRLGDADQVRRKVFFPVSGTWAQVPGVIVMYLDDNAGRKVDPVWSGITVVFNANPWPVRQQVTVLRKHDWSLHPALVAGADWVVRTCRCDDGVVFVPGRTTAVLVRRG